MTKCRHHKPNTSLPLLDRGLLLPLLPGNESETAARKQSCAQGPQPGLSGLAKKTQAGNGAGSLSPFAGTLTQPHTAMAGLQGAASALRTSVYLQLSKINPCSQGSPMGCALGALWGGGDSCLPWEGPARALPFLPRRGHEESTAFVSPCIQHGLGGAAYLRACP